MLLEDGYSDLVGRWIRWKMDLVILLEDGYSDVVGRWI